MEKIYVKLIYSQPKTPGLVWSSVNLLNSYQMRRNLIPYMPADQVRLCNANNDCIEARGENARFIVLAVVVVLFCIGIAALAKAR